MRAYFRWQLAQGLRQQDTNGGVEYVEPISKLPRAVDPL